MAGMNQFTQKAKRVLSLAQLEAEGLRQSEIGTEHLLIGMVLENDTIAQRVLSDLGLVLNDLRSLLTPLETEHSVPQTFFSMRNSRKHLKTLWKKLKGVVSQMLAQSICCLVWRIMNLTKLCSCLCSLASLPNKSAGKPAV